MLRCEGVVLRSVNGPGKPYCSIPEGLTGDVGMGSGPDAETGRGEDVVDVGGRETGAIVGDGCCLGFEE